MSAACATSLPRETYTWSLRHADCAGLQKGYFVAFVKYSGTNNITGKQLPGKRCMHFPAEKALSKFGQSFGYNSGKLIPENMLIRQGPDQQPGRNDLHLFDPDGFGQDYSLQWIHPNVWNLDWLPSSLRNA